MRVEADPRQGIDAARLIRHVYDAVACGIIVRDGGGTLVHANDAALRMFGATRDQIVGQPLLGGVARFREDGTPLTRDDLVSVRALREKRAIRGEVTRVVRADGTDVWLLGEAVPVMGADGEPALIVTSFMDVTAERRAQAERHEAEARLRAAVATSPVMLFVLDRDGRFLLSEGGALKRLGLAPGEAIGRSAIEMYANVPAIVWSIERALEGEAVKTKVDLGGVAFDVDYAPLRDAKGETYSVVGLAVDVTERSRAERHLKTVHAVTRVIAGASRHRDVRQEILRTLGESFRWDAAVFWRVDAARNVMHVRETWQSDGADLDAWFAACRSRELRKGEGLPGRVWASATSAWISDVSVEPGFTRAQAATDARLHTVLCFPIRHGDRVFAAIEFWSREVRREVDHDLFAVLEAVADQIGGFVARRTVQLQLQASEARLRGIIDSALDAVVTLDETGRITEWSPGAQTLFGWTREEAMGHRLTENIIPERYRGRHEAALARFLATGERTILGRRIEIEAQHRDGHELPVELTVSATRSEGGWVFSAFIRDIADRKRMEDDLRSSEARFRLLAENSTDLITRLDPDGRRLYVSPAARTILGYEPDELLGTRVEDFVHPDDAADALTALRAVAADGGARRFTLRMRRKDGTFVWLELATRAVRDVEGAIVEIQSSSRDVTERVRAEEALAHQALHDSLTGLPNRALLQDRVEQALLAARRHGTSLALLFADLDRFKEVNDTFGHPMGDDLLREVAVRLRMAVRAADTVARLGGDEFAILLPQITDVREAMDVCERIRASLATPVVIGSDTLFVEASVGIALSPDHGNDVDTLMRHADVAMYVAKRADTDCAVYEPGADRYSPTVIELASDLRHSIERGELALHFQPIVDMRSRQVVAVEALCRWRHPERGMVPATEFIALAEESGFIRQLGLWTLAEALRQRAHLWPEEGRRGDVAVNMSLRNLRSAELPAVIDNLLRTWNVPPSALRIEVTETSAMADVERTLATLTQLHEMGVAISIDDFGTGYSSLAYLHRMPVDQLKIDRSFILDLEENANSQAIVGSTIVLAHSLGLKAVAEGVETAQAYKRLAALGCDLAQGNYFGAPLPPGELAPALRGSPWSLA